MKVKLVSLDKLSKKKGFKRGNGHENEKKGKKRHLLVKVHQILLNAL
jgi:hypothetical protein